MTTDWPMPEPTYGEDGHLHLWNDEDVCAICNAPRPNSEDGEDERLVDGR